MGEDFSAPAERQFVRDRLTWLGYLLVGNYCFIMAALGPLMPFLRSEWNLSYTVAACHFSAWALGSLTAGLVGDRVLGALGKGRTMWGCAGGLSVATAAFVLAGGVYLTVGIAFICGMAGSMMGQAISTTYADRFGDHRAVAFVEQNICASIYCAFAPIVVGAFAKSGLGWRFALVIPLAQFMLVSFVFRKTQVPGATIGPGQVGWKAKLPLAYWAYWAVMLLMVACEWSLIYWSAEFLRTVDHLSKAVASQAVSAYLGGMLLGRVGGRAVARRVPIRIVLPVGSAIAIAGFLLFWLSHKTDVNVMGLFLTGIGISNFYPLTMAAAIGAAENQSAVAAVRFSVGSGIAILLAPLLLGMVADRSGIFCAYGLVAVLLCLAAVLVFFANAIAGRHDLTPNQIEMEAESPPL